MQPDARPLHRRAAFLRSYAFLPHRLLNRATARVTALEHPRWAVDAAVDLWRRREGIDLTDFEPRRYRSLDDFFLRRLRPGARPLGDDFVAPADGLLVDSGTITRAGTLRVKGQDLSVQRVLGERVSAEPYLGGQYAVIFLTPRGYHRVHMPTAGTLERISWVPGRYFPQNLDALQHIPRVYERNERAVLELSAERGFVFSLVMVGASLIGGIFVDAARQDEWMRRDPLPRQRRYERGDELGHFAFGSTVVALLPAQAGAVLGLHDEVRMGQTLFRLPAAGADATGSSRR